MRRAKDLLPVTLNQRAVLRAKSGFWRPPRKETPTKFTEKAGPCLLPGSWSRGATAPKRWQSLGSSTSVTPLLPFIPEKLPKLAFFQQEVIEVFFA